MHLNLRQIALASTFFVCGSFVFASVKNVKVKEPGTLAEKVGVGNKYNIRAIKIKGALNADDVRFLRDMAGGDSLFNSTPGKLVDIDLTDVSFVPGPESFLSKRSQYKITGKHTIPQTFLYKCPVERVVLPARLDSIGDWAFSSTNIKKFDVPESVYLSPRAIGSCEYLEDLRLPSMESQALTPVQYVFPKLRKVIFGDVDYVVSGGFVDLQDIEEIVFDGLVGHIDGYGVTNCPKLKRIIFKGPVAGTGGAQFVKDCPELEEVVFDGLVFKSGFGEPVNCPKLKGYTQNGVVLDGDSTVFRIGTLEDVINDPKMKAQAEKLLDYKIRTLNSPSYPFLEMIEISNFDETEELAKSIGKNEILEKVSQVVDPIKEDMEKTKLQLLKETPDYKADNIQYEWKYAMPSDSVLALDRKYFNLDSIAGNGDDISRIKNLMYWVHDAVRHDGSSYNPKSKSLIDLYEVCEKEKRGVNCRMMAIMLTEALLAEGIPARYLTCQPKLWQFDSDCHVICVAWSESLGKWVWVDPTFAAFVADENGVMLHPGEVRERLIKGGKVIMNPDANWNHESPQTQEDYIDYYMAKNLYYITAITENRPRPEGANSKKSTYVLLSPAGAERTPNADIVTSDYEKFWSAPNKE